MSLGSLSFKLVADGQISKDQRGGIGYPNSSRVVVGKLIDFSEIETGPNGPAAIESAPLWNLHGIGDIQRDLGPLTTVHNTQRQATGSIVAHQNVYTTATERVDPWRAFSKSTRNCSVPK